MGAYLMHMVLVLIALTCVNLALLLRSRNKGVSQASLDELYLKIHEEIKFAVAPRSIEVSLGVNELIDLAVEIWRVEQRLKKSSENLPENHRKALEISMEKMRRYIEKYDIEVLDYTNQKFNEGLNLDVLSIEKDPALPESIVKETIEPTIICKGQVVRRAKIILLSNQ